MAKQVSFVGDFNYNSLNYSEFTQESFDLLITKPITEATVPTVNENIQTFAGLGLTLPSGGNAGGGIVETELADSSFVLLNTTGYSGERKNEISLSNSGISNRMNYAFVDGGSDSFIQAIRRPYNFSSALETVPIVEPVTNGITRSFSTPNSCFSQDVEPAYASSRGLTIATNGAQSGARVLHRRISTNTFVSDTSVTGVIGNCSSFLLNTTTVIAAFGHLSSSCAVRIFTLTSSGSTQTNGLSLTATGSQSVATAYYPPSLASGALGDYLVFFNTTFYRRRLGSSSTLNTYTLNDYYIDRFWFFGNRLFFLGYFNPGNGSINTAGTYMSLDVFSVVWNNGVSGTPTNHGTIETFRDCNRGVVLTKGYSPMVMFEGAKFNQVFNMNTRTLEPIEKYIQGITTAQKSYYATGLTTRSNLDPRIEVVLKSTPTNPYQFTNPTYLTGYIQTT